MKFEAMLRHSVRYCGYTGATLNDCLVEQFIQEIKSKAIAKNLLEKEGKISLNEPELLRLQTLSFYLSGKQ